MKKYYTLALLCFFELSIWNNVQSQNPGEWMWIHGSNLMGSAGNFGIQGVSSPANEPPSVYEACEWQDLNGNFWFYGGVNFGTGTYADLWKYDPGINEWIWMKGPGTVAYPGNYGIQGVPDPANNPTSRSHGSSTWVDQQGNLWMFGGLNGSVYSDLWKYEIASNTWTWMKGPNTPGQAGIYGTQGIPSPLNEPPSKREMASSWTDNAGDLWFIGGYGAGLYNDMWRYNIANNEWTWMKGASFSGQSGTYGTQGVVDPLNTPGARMVHCRWKDGAGNLWLLGGGDYFSNTFYNDLWRFNPLTNNWTWMRGSNTPNSNGSYGTQCVTAPTNDPPARFENRAAWTDVNGNFWCFGGGIDGGLSLVWNDLWMYCVSTNEWTWIDGSNSISPPGNWGSLNVSDPLNTPDGRGGSLGWSDDSGHLFLFGGWGTYNDLWKYTIDISCALCNSLPIALFTAPHHVCPGTCTDFTNHSINATSYLWIFPGGTPSTSTDVHPAGICYNTPGTYDVTLHASNINGSDSVWLPNYITVFPYSPSQSILQNGDTLISNTGFVSYQWFYDGDTIPGATDYYYVATQSGDFSVVCIDNNGCSVEAVVLNVIASIKNTIDHEQPIVVYPNPVVDEFGVRSSEFGVTADAISIYNVLGEKVFSAVNCILSTVDCRLLSTGMYYLEITDGEKSFRVKFIKQ